MYQAKDLLNNLQKKIYEFYIDLSRENRKGEVSYAFVCARLETIRNNAADLERFLDTYFSRNPQLARVFENLLSSIDVLYSRYKDKIERLDPRTPLPPHEFETLQYAPEVWISRIENIISYLAPPGSINIKIVDPEGVMHSTISTLNEKVGDAVSRTLSVSGNFVYKIGELQLGPRYSKKSLYELGVQPGSTIHIEPARGEMIPSSPFDRPVILRGKRTLEARKTFIIGRIWGERLGIRSLPSDMYVGQIMEEIRTVDVEQVFSADAENWLHEKCSRYVSRIHAIIYQKGSNFFFLDVSLNGSILITDGDEKDIRSGRNEFDETGQITPYRLSSSNTVKLFGTLLDIILKRY